MKFEWRSLVCRMVKVFFPSSATPRSQHKRIVAPTATERARKSRREGVSRDVVSFPTSLAASSSWTVFSVSHEQCIEHSLPTVPNTQNTSVAIVGNWFGTNVPCRNKPSYRYDTVLARLALGAG